MDARGERRLASIRRITESFVREYHEDEGRFFPLVWEVFDGWVKNLKDCESVTLASDTLLANVQTGLGFAQESAMDLVTPRVLAATYAAVFEATKAGTEAHVPAIVKAHGKRFDVPPHFLPILEELLTMLVRADYEQAGILPVGELGHDQLMVIRWDGTRTGTRTDLEKEIDRARAVKQRMDLFLDDMANEFLVKVQPRCLPPLQRRLLVMLLLRVGDYWEYADLFGKVWGDEATPADTFHQLLNKLHKTTEGVLRPFVEIPAGLERCYVQASLKSRVKYAVIVVQGVY